MLLTAGAGANKLKPANPRSAFCSKLSVRIEPPRQWQVIPSRLRWGRWFDIDLWVGSLHAAYDNMWFNLNLGSGWDARVSLIASELSFPVYGHADSRFEPF
jgi:hypothetical protein